MKIILVTAPSGEILMVLDDGSPMPIVCGQFTPAEKSASLAHDLMLMYNNHQSATTKDNVVAFHKEKHNGKD